MSTIRQTGNAFEDRTTRLAAFVAGFKANSLPADARRHAADACVEGTGAILAALHPAVTTAARIGHFAETTGGSGRATLIGHDKCIDPVNAALANGTLGYACDIEPFHPGGILHPIACILPAALAAAEHAGVSGQAMLGAVALGCEVTYRVSISIGPTQQYNLGFHPSALCGVFGTTAAAANLLGLDADATERAFGLAACQASGLMAWESDPTENSRPFQMGMAARNGLTAAILAADGFGGPRGVFDHGHTVYKAFSRGPQPDLLTRALGEAWRGVTELAFKPYPCVAFMHPGLDAALAIRSKENIASTDISKVDLHFGRSGVHCIDNNPLKSHSAQYTLAVALTHGSLDIVNLFTDLRNSDPEVRRLSKCITVAADEGELEEAFPARYATVVEIETRDGRRLRQRQDIARGYPDAPMSARELHAKFLRIVTPAIGAHAAARAFEAARGLWDSMSVEPYAASLRARPAEVTTRP